MSASTGSPPSAEPRRKLIWAGLVALIFVAVAIAARGLPWREAWLALAAAQPGWVIAGLAANIALFPLWTSQWRWLTPPAQRPGWGRMLEVVSLTSLTQNVLPLLGGQATAIGLLALRGGLSRGAAVSVLALDQILTGVGKLVALGFAAWLTPMPRWMRDGTWSLFGAVAAIVFVLILLAHSTDRLHGFARKSRGMLARALANAGTFTEHLSELRRGGGAIWIALGYALGKKALEIAAVLAVQYACGIALSPASAVLVVAALGLSTMIRTPGNLGVYEATVVLIYGSLGVSPTLCLAAAVLQHFVALLPRLGGGLIVLAARGSTVAPKR